MSDVLGDLAAEFERAYNTGRIKLLTPLPHKVRLRLWFAGRIDHLGCWLVEHRCFRAAKLLWRI